MGASAIAIVTARGGSKRIPDKNIRNFLGKPIIAYVIEAALETQLFGEVMVSTDNSHIADIAMKYGAKVPFWRSNKNSDDFAGTDEVLIEVLEKYKEKGMSYIYACCLYPTAAFITPEHLQKGYEMLVNHHFKTVFPVLAFSSPIQRSLKISNNRVSMFYPENYGKRSQDLELAYHDAGQFYWLHVNDFMEKKKLWTDFSGALILSETEAQDIDSEEDWKIAEMKYAYLHNISLKT